jgi:hypothetical protein
VIYVANLYICIIILIQKSNIYRHFRALEDLVDMRFPYFGEHVPEEEISDEERKEIHMIIDKMEREKVLEEWNKI